MRARCSYGDAVGFETNFDVGVHGTFDSEIDGKQFAGINLGGSFGGQ